jgi:hypothetical protein
VSAWHRDNPELVGTDADPWMRNPTHAAAHRELELRDRADASARRLGFSSIEAAIAHAEANSSHVCDAVNGCGEIQGATASGRCRYCGCVLTEREP